MFCFTTDAQSSGTPELAFADGFPVVIGDVILYDDVAIDCQAHNNTGGLPITDYEWNVTAADGGSPWTCYETSFSVIVCTVDNDCTMNVECTPYSGAVPGRAHIGGVTLDFIRTDMVYVGFFSYIGLKVFLQDNTLLCV